MPWRPPVARSIAVLTPTPARSVQPLNGREPKSAVACSQQPLGAGLACHRRRAAATARGARHSAHWYILATAVTATAQPRTIHHFGGFRRRCSRCATRRPAAFDDELGVRLCAVRDEGAPPCCGSAEPRARGRAQPARLRLRRASAGAYDWAGEPRRSWIRAVGEGWSQAEQLGPVTRPFWSETNERSRQHPVRH